MLFSFKLYFRGGGMTIGKGWFPPRCKDGGGQFLHAAAN